MFSALKPGALFVRNRRCDEWVDEADLPEAVAAALYARLLHNGVRRTAPITEILEAAERSRGDAFKEDERRRQRRDVGPVNEGPSTAQYLEGWPTAAPEQLEAMQQAYRDRIRADQETSRRPRGGKQVDRGHALRASPVIRTRDRRQQAQQRCGASRRARGRAR
jgi:hypothetical protein